MHPRFSLGARQTLKRSSKDTLRSFRPLEKAAALNFYEYGLNRLTIGDLRTMVASAGFDDIVLMPYPTDSNIAMLDLEILEAVGNTMRVLPISI